MTRKYQRIRLGAGDWLLPSNDGATMYRLLHYVEEGDVERWDEKRQAWRPLRGRWWRALEIPMATLREHTRSGAEPWDAPWDELAGPFKTLTEVTEYVEEHMEPNPPASPEAPS